MGCVGLSQSQERVKVANGLLLFIQFEGGLGVETAQLSVRLFPSVRLSVGQLSLSE